MKRIYKPILAVILALICISARAQEFGVIFSEPSGVKTASFSVSLSTDDPTREIHYTTDGKIPSLQSTKYTKPIQISQTTQIIALSWKNNVADSLPSRAGYVFIDQGIRSFTSNLPIIVIENFGQGALPQAASLSGGDVVEKQFSVSAFFTPVGGRSSLSNQPELVTNAGIKIRGSSSSSFKKKSFGFDAWDKTAQETDIKPLGMPSSADWLLSGSRDIDETYIRSVFMYQLSNEIGRWAPHSKAVEVYLNTNGGNVTKDDYLGIYFFMEKIARSKNKVDIEKLGPEVGPKNPDISGGYIIKVDRLDPEATGFKTQMSDGQFGVTNYYYPKERNMPDSQKMWIRDYFTTFESALAKIPGSREYTNYFDAPSCIDQWILNVMPFNVDAFMFSNYMYKPRNGTIHLGPLWDTDRALGANDFRLNNPERWDSDMLADVWTYGWFTQLFKDPEFDQGLRDRWYEIRQDAFAMDHMKGIIDSLANVMREASKRDSLLWGFTRGFQGEINYLKTWMERRVLWIDGQLGYTPQFYNASSLISGRSAKVAAGFNLRIDKPSGKQGDIYYTLDGSDPRLVGGAVNSVAKTYSSTIAINHTTTVFARIKNGTAWSCFRKVTFVVQQDLSKLKITEINYNPQKQSGVDGDNYEFIELKNTGSEKLYLSGVTFSDGVEFTFPDSATIAPGAFVVIASNAQRFSELYGKKPNYQYTGKLDNGGETVTLSDIFGSTITSVFFDDIAPWPTQADGLGYTLVPIVVSPVADQNAANQWRSSAVFTGSPWKDDVLLDIKKILVNEVITNASYPNLNAIELYNPNAEDVAIGGWIITNKPLLSKQWRIPANTVIKANQYVVFYQGHYNGTSLQYAANEFGSAVSLNRLGDDVYIYSSDGTNLTGYSHGLKLEEALENTSYGNYTTSVGQTNVVPLQNTSLGARNAAPKAGPVVISQIYYNPPLVNAAASGSEFIQLKNITNTTINLYDQANTQNTWTVSGIGFAFSGQTSIAAGDSLYLISTDMSIADFRERYSLPSTTQIFTFSKKLDNAGEEIALRVPLAPYTDNGTSIVPTAALERVAYQSTLPWPDANGNGKMLQRIKPGEYSNDVINWKAADGKGKLPPIRNLTVVDGTGGGQILQGATAAVFVSDAPTGKAFYQWTSSSIGLLTNTQQTEQTFKMPDYDVTLTAIYTDIVSQTPIAQGSQWKYNNLGIDLGTTWREETYNDASWATANTMLGTGTGVVSTINIGATNNRFPTIYFRKTITVADINLLRSADFEINYDDGAIVYVNGVEVQRLNMPQGVISYATWASSSFNSGGMQTFAIDPRFFQTGTNVIQVEVHNSSATSSDLVFDAQLKTTVVAAPRFTDVQTIVLKKGWNLVSFYVEPNEPSVASVFSGLNIQEIKTEEVFWRKGQADALNSLKTLKAGEGYLVYANAEGTLKVVGYSIGSMLHTQIAVGSGWQLIGVPSSKTQQLTILPATTEAIKDFDGFYISGNTVGTLQYINPGKAYFIKSKITTSITFE